MVVLSDKIYVDLEAIRKLYDEYNMTAEGVHKDVADIRQWMSTQSHFPRIPPSKDGMYCDLLWLRILLIF